jgi:hypothetical protein
MAPVNCAAICRQVGVSSPLTDRALASAGIGALKLGRAEVVAGRDRFRAAARRLVRAV